MSNSGIVPAGSLTFGAHISGSNQFLVPNGLANGQPIPMDMNVSARAIVPVRSWVYAMTWNFERNTTHEFRLIRIGRETEYKWLSFQEPSGVLQYPEPSLMFEQGDSLQIASHHLSGINFPGPIIVTLYLAEL